MTSTATRPADAATQRWPRRRGFLVVGALATCTIGMGLIHLSQGTADVELLEVWSAVSGGPDSAAATIVVESRLPRLLAALLTGGALAMAGAALQSATRNPLASPETVGVGAGAYLSLTTASVVGLSLSPVVGLVVATGGGLAAGGLVLALSSAGGSGGALRVVLAGSALTMGLSSVTSVLLLLNPWQTQGMFAWGAGTLAQNGLSGVGSMLPIAAAAGLGLLLLGRRLDLLQLGDDAASTMGVRVATTRRTVVVLAVVLIATSVTVTGPVGFVGLCAPAIMRLASRRLPSLRLQRTFLVGSAITGCGLVLTSDVLLRLAFGAIKGVNVPVGVLTSLVGAALLVVLSRRLPGREDGGESIGAMRGGLCTSTTAKRWLIASAGTILIGAMLAAVLIGDRTLLLGDLVYWLQQVASPRVDFIFATRTPRVLGAALAGAALGLAGLLVQSITRNPLADPGVLGVSSAAGAGAVAVITLTSAPADSAVFLAALGGAVAAAVMLFALGGGDPFRLIMVGIAVGAAGSALITLLLIRSDPWEQTRAMTWLGGSTYATTAGHMLPLVVLVAVTIVVVTRTRRDLDVLQLDEITPHVLGVPVARARLLHIGLAAAVTAAATAAVGVFAFVGLIAPHVARMAVGKRHASVVPLTIIIGALTVVLADLVGRVVIAPAQLPAGLVVAVVGTPFFLLILRRSQNRG